MGKCGDGIAGNERQTPALGAKFHRLHVPAFEAWASLDARLKAEPLASAGKTWRNKPQDATDEAQIRALIEQWSKAVRDENRAAIRADHDADILMFDVPPPFLSRGLDAYMATWDTFFASVERPVSFAFHDVEVTCGADVAFATAVGRCVNIEPTASVSRSNSG